MVRVILENLSYLDCGGGYGDGESIHIDSNCPYQTQCEILVHEVIENFARKHRVDHKVIHIRHDRLDLLASELLDALKQLEAFNANQT